MPKAPLITLKNVTKCYRPSEEVEVKALDDVSLTIHQGEFLAIMGPSGSGKSTLMHILGFLDVPSHGQYRFNGKRTEHLSENELADIRNKKVGFVFQAFNLLPRTSTLDNVRLPMIYAKVPYTEQERRAKQALKSVGLEKVMEHKPNEISGGQQQRVAIARALINKPQVLFADEPTGNLDSKSGEEIMAIFRKLNKEGNTIIMVTHEDIVAANAKRILHLKDGKIVHDRKKRS